MKLKFELYTDRLKQQDSALIHFFKRCSDKGIVITRYDYKEPVKRTFDLEHPDEMLNMYEEYGNLLVKGKNRFWLSTNTFLEGIACWGGSITCNTKITLEDFAWCLHALSANNSFLFGAISSEDEFDAKHKEHGNSSVGWPGVSIHDFRQFLPGVYRYTIFGKRIVDAIGRERFISSEDGTFSEIEDGSLALLLDGAYDIENTEDLILKEKKIAQQIGDSYFYDRDGDSSLKSHPASFREYLEKVEATFMAYVEELRNG